MSPVLDDVFPDAETGKDEEGIGNIIYSKVLDEENRRKKDYRCRGMRNALMPTAVPSSAAFLLFSSALLYFLFVSQEVRERPLFASLRVMEEDNNPFSEKIVHFDLKGAPPKLSFYAEIFPLLRKMHVTGVLMEYEDMFPYSGSIAILRRRSSYSTDEIANILQMALNNDLEVIPLVQTFGHLEFALKHDSFAHLREDSAHTDTICPSSNESIFLITEIIRQIRALHPQSKRIHIGADEAWQIAKDERCQIRLRNELQFSTDRLKLSHISRTARIALQESGFLEVLAWNDMFGSIDAKLLKEYELGKLLTPVVWGYVTDVTVPGYFPAGMFERYSQVFDKLLFGSAFKGANGIKEAFINVNRYLANQESYVSLYRTNKTFLEGKVKGIVLTGWQRYYHAAPLCELLPVGLPSLVLDLVYLNNTSLSIFEITNFTKEILGCLPKVPTMIPTKFGNHTFVPSVENEFMNCSFPGHAVYDAVESLRFITWKVHRAPQSYSVKDPLRNELSEVESKIREAMGAYFYSDAIEEFLTTYVTPLRMLL